MNKDYERLDRVCRAAKQEYDAAERALASARFTLNYAERARKVEWDKIAATRDDGFGPYGIKINGSPVTAATGSRGNS